MKKIMLGIIRFYRKHISPLFPPRCKYYPTCSSYALEAIEVHGAFKGGIMALFRLAAACQSIEQGGFPAVRIARKCDNHSKSTSFRNKLLSLIRSYNVSKIIFI